MVSLAPLGANAAIPQTMFQYTPDAAGPVVVSQSSGHATVQFGDKASPIIGDIVRPKAGRNGHIPSVLFVHWLGDDEKTTNRTEFADDAAELAKHGVMSLLIDAPWSAKDWFMKVRSPETDYSNSIQYVIALRRSLDALVALGADPSEIAFVGHDFGAMYGSLLSAVDERPKYYVLMAGTSSFAQWYLLGKKPQDLDAYKAQMAPLDPPQYLSSSHGSAFFFQYANKDAYIKPERAREVYEAAPVPKTVAFYAADHSLNVADAHTDRIAWLLHHLKTAHR